MRKVIEVNKENLSLYIVDKFYIMQKSSSFSYGKKMDINLLMADMEDCLDAHFFDEKGDLHIFDFQGEKRAVYTFEEDGSETIEEYQMIKDEGIKTLGILKAVNYDEYGQMYVEYTRPFKLS